MYKDKEKPTGTFRWTKGQTGRKKNTNMQKDTEKQTGRFRWTNGQAKDRIEKQTDLLSPTMRIG